MEHENFSKLENRNARAKELKALGYVVRKRSTGPCQLHPEYIKDWPYEYQTGFGNTDYTTYHKNVYQVEYQEVI